VMWIVVVGFFVAAIYWIIAHIDDVGRGVTHMIQKSRADRAPTPPTAPQNPPAPFSQSSLPREVFVEFVADGLWDLLKRWRNRP
jgi:hypothetical protein